MDIPTAIEILTGVTNQIQPASSKDFRDAIKLATTYLKCWPPQPTHAVICEDPELAKAIAQDVNILHNLAFASSLTLNDDLKNASKHGARALGALAIAVQDPSFRIRLDALYE